MIFELDDDLRTASAVAEIDGFAQPNSVVTDGADGIYVAERPLGTVSYLDIANKRRQLLTSDMVAPTGMVIDTDGSLVVADGGAEKIYRIINNGPHAVQMGVIAGAGVTGSRDGASRNGEDIDVCRRGSGGRADSRAGGARVSGVG